MSSTEFTLDSSLSSASSSLDSDSVCEAEYLFYVPRRHKKASLFEKSHIKLSEVEEAEEMTDGQKVEYAESNEGSELGVAESEEGTAGSEDDDDEDEDDDNKSTKTQDQRKTQEPLDEDTYKLQMNYYYGIEETTCMTMSALSCPEVPWSGCNKVAEELDNLEICDTEVSDLTSLKRLHTSSSCEYEVREKILQGRKPVPKVAWQLPGVFKCYVMECDEKFRYFHRFREHLELIHKIQQTKDIPVCLYCLKPAENIKGKREVLTDCAFSHNPFKKLILETTNKNTKEVKKTTKNRYFCVICLNAAKRNEGKDKDETKKKAVYRGFATQANYRDHLAGHHEVTELQYFCAICASAHSKDTSRQACQRQCLISRAPLKCFHCKEGGNKKRTFPTMVDKVQHYLRRHERFISTLFMNELNQRNSDLSAVKKEIQKERKDRMEEARKNRLAAMAAGKARAKAKEEAEKKEKEDKKTPKKTGKRATDGKKTTERDKEQPKATPKGKSASHRKEDSDGEEGKKSRKEPHKSTPKAKSSSHGKEDSDVEDEKKSRREPQKSAKKKNSSHFKRFIFRFR